MNLEKELQKKLDALYGEIEGIRAFAENLATTEDYTMEVYSDDAGCDIEAEIDGSEISRDLLNLVEDAHDAYLELSDAVDALLQEKSNEEKGV